MLSRGINPKKEVVELLVGSVTPSDGRSKSYLKEAGVQDGFSLFRGEFVNLLARELGVSCEVLRNNVDFLVKKEVLV